MNTNNSKVLVFAVIYPGVEPFLREYFNSLYNQDDMGFKLLLIEDGLSLPKEFRRDNQIVISVSKLTPAEIRYKAIKYAQDNKYDIIIFTDSDDFYTDNRISATKELLQNADFCANEIVLVNKNGAMLENSQFVNLQKIDFLRLIKSNCLGLSNTAALVGSFPKKFEIPSSIIAVDWWIFSIFFLNNKTYIFDEKSKTYYRQHINNAIGFSEVLTKTMLHKGIYVKDIHYRHMLEYCQKNSLFQFVDVFQMELASINELKEFLSKYNNTEIYIDKITRNFNKIKSDWWSEILSINEWNEYE